jgi:inner membrane protein
MEKEESFLKRITSSVSFKLSVIGILTLLLLIPATMIQGLIREREQRRDETVNEVTSKWGNAQTLSGPVLSIPYKTYHQTREGMVTSIHYAHFLPSLCDIRGKLTPEIRKRGIYKVIAYNTLLKVQGKFDTVNLKSLKIDPADILWEEATVEIGIPDMRGINQTMVIQWNESSLPLMPGIPVKDIHASGVYAGVPASENAAIQFSFSLDINGSHSLHFIPVGKETTVLMESSWNSPSFTGAFLPDDHHISDSGFTARWNILQLNRNYPQQWTDNQFIMEDSAFGVNLIIPVDAYQKSMRSVKYALLFIALTFLILFFAEVIQKVRIHPVQYLLVGMALCIFYTLLTALSEHISFSMSYLLATAVIIALITLFTHSLYNNYRVSLIVGGSLALLYVFLYVVLQLSDYALLFGSVGLLVILAVVMYFARKIDWYAPVRNHDNEHQNL